MAQDWWIEREKYRLWEEAKRRAPPNLARREYEFIAELINSMQPPSDSDAEHTVLFNTFKQLFALNIAKGLAKTSTSFDALKFLEACGVNQTMAQAFSKATWMKKED